MPDDFNDPNVMPRPVDLFDVRHRPVHGVHIDENHPTIVFDTVCTKDRRQWLATIEVHTCLREISKTSTAWLMGKYMILPDHIHFFAAPSVDAVDYQNWVKFWKSRFTREFVPGIDETDVERDWLSGNWDTRLRSWQSYDEKWEYVRNNPVRHGLVARAEDWPFQGEIHRLRWE